MIPEEELICDVENGGLDGEGGRMSDWERMNSSSGSSSRSSSWSSLGTGATSWSLLSSSSPVVDGQWGGGRVEKMLAIHKQQSNRCNDSPSSPLLLAPLYSDSTAKEAAKSRKLRRKFFFSRCGKWAAPTLSMLAVDVS